MGVYGDISPVMLWADIFTAAGKQKYGRHKWDDRSITLKWLVYQTKTSESHSEMTSQSHEANWLVNHTKWIDQSVYHTKWNDQSITQSEMTSLYHNL